MLQELSILVTYAFENIRGIIFFDHFSDLTEFIATCRK